MNSIDTYGFMYMGTWNVFLEGLSPGFVGTIARTRDVGWFCIRVKGKS